MITVQGLLIGTGILIALKLLLVSPITTFLVSRALVARAARDSLDPEEVANDAAIVDSYVTPYYILVDTLVLGIAGFLMGRFLGWYFIGFSTSARGWPGILAFIISSYLGAHPN